MHQLSPQETFPIVYLISDPSDANTYYVRAVLRNSVSGAIIQVNGQNYVNLTDLTNRRFAQSIQAPNDPSGLGLYMDVTVSVYTDSGYTTKSDAYQEENAKYLVQQRWNQALGGGAGGFVSTKEVVDYKRIAQIVLEVFLGLPTTEIPAFDLSPVLARCDELCGLIEGVKMPEIPKIDLKPHTDSVVAALQLFARDLRQNMPKLDFQPVLDAISKIKFPEAKDYEQNFGKLHEAIQGLLPNIDKYNKYSGFGKTIDGLVKEYGEGAPQSPVEKRKFEVDPRVKALFPESE